MSDVDAFFDNNVVLYSLSNEAWRKERVAHLMSGGGVLSTQVLAESANVMRRKLKLDIADIEAFHDVLLEACRIRLVEPATVRHALEVSGRYGFSIYDSLIVATALEAGCTTLHSEDPRHGQVIEEALAIINPFL
jgi:predicted nucleic acid-binding protein